ncbi:unnamed protein product, partial [Cylicostephanus goldi]
MRELHDEDEERFVEIVEEDDEQDTGNQAPKERKKSNSPAEGEPFVEVMEEDNDEELNLMRKQELRLEIRRIEQEVKDWRILIE